MAECYMITEIAPLVVIPGEEEAFEEAFAEAHQIIASMPGYLGLELQRCLETENRYTLIVRWDRLEDHTEGFRDTPAYETWKDLLHHFYDPFPEVLHYRMVLAD